MRQSSIEAHEAVKPEKPKHYSIIKNAMRKIEKPATSKTIAANCHLEYAQVHKRLSEMRKAGIIEERGRSENEKYKPILWAIKN